MQGCLASDVFEQTEVEVQRIKTELKRKGVLMDTVNEWISALDEERWLDAYLDENRYSAGKGAQKNLKKARTIVSKIPSMVENLTAKVKAWELDNGISLFYDKVPLLNSLQEYAVQRQEKEEEKVKCQDAYDRIIERVRDGERYYAQNFPGLSPKVICVKVYEARKLAQCLFLWESQTCCLAGYPHLVIELTKLFSELTGGYWKLTTEESDVVSPWPSYKAEYPPEPFLMKLDVIKMVKEDDESNLKKILVVFRSPMPINPSYLKISNRVDKYSLFFRAFILKLSALTREHPPDSFSSQSLLRGEESNYKFRFVSDHEDLNPPLRFWKVTEEGGIEDDICEDGATAIEVDGGLSFSEFLDKLVMIEVERVDF